jgi:hypothetical protein
LRYAASFDHLVGAGEKVGRHAQPKVLRSLKVDDHFKSGRLNDRQVGRAFALEARPT